MGHFKYKTEPLNPYETKEDYIIKKVVKIIKVNQVMVMNIIY